MMIDRSLLRAATDSDFALASITTQPSDSAKQGRTQSVCGAA